MSKIGLQSQAGAIVGLPKLLPKKPAAYKLLGNALNLGVARFIREASPETFIVLRPAYIAAIAVPIGTYGEKQLWLKDGALLAGPDADTAHPLADADYMLLQLEIRAERDDWDSLTSIAEPFNKAFDALKQVDASGNPKLADAEVFIRTAALAAVTSTDLTDTDASE